jgi:hypothetical protein
MHTTMKTFENLQDIWNQQNDFNTNKTASELIKKSEEHRKKIKLNHIATLIIIGITTLILLCYFVWLGIYSVSIFTIGLGLMISSMILRIILEFISVKKFNTLNIETSLLEYSKNAALFYTWRKVIHFIATPIIYIIYTIGFSLLIPTFQEQFSTPFFIYLLVSGYGFLIVFAFFLNKKLKKEMKILAFLKNIE